MEGYTDPQTTWHEKAREKMVTEQIVARGVKDRAVIAAMRKVPRHLFVPAEYASEAYDDNPLPIGYGQTISQPYIVALMTEVTEPAKEKRVLEIGTGSGYQAAVLAEICETVYTIEIVPELAEVSGALLKKSGYTNIVSKYGDGYAGWPEYAPFDIIVVTAAPREIPRPLIDQLADGGKMVIPVGHPAAVQELILVEKTHGVIVQSRISFVRFVPFRRLPEDIGKKIK